MEKLQSKDIEWQEGDVVAAVEIGQNEVYLKFSFEPTKHTSYLGDFFDFNGHKFNSEYFYIVNRETEPVKAVVDATMVAVNDCKGVWPFKVTNTGFVDGVYIARPQFNQCVTDLTGDPLYHYAWLTALNDMRRQKEEQTTEEVLHGLFDKSRSPWVNLANLCGKMAKEHPAEAFAEGEGATKNFNVAVDEIIQRRNKAITDSEPVKEWRELEAIKPMDCRCVQAEIKPTYTQAMKDAGELPSVGMECMLIGVNKRTYCEITYISNEVGCYRVLEKGDYSSNGKEFTFALDCVSFSPIDTRTPEQKQVEETAHFIDINHGASSSFIAKEMQESGLLAEIKQC